MSTTGHESEAINVGGLKAAMQKFKTEKVDVKSDKSSTVSDVTFDGSTSKLKKTVNGQTTDVCSIAQGGYRIIEDNTNGIDELSAIGGATITDDNTNGLDVLTF